MSERTGSSVGLLAARGWEGEREGETEADMGGGGGEKKKPNREDVLTMANQWLRGLGRLQAQVLEPGFQMWSGMKVKH